PEDVAEGLEDLLKAPEAARLSALAHAGVAELVVDLALLGVAEDFVRLGRLLEALLGLRVVLVAVGMELEGELAIRLLDLVLRGGARDAEDFVVVTARRHGLLSRAPDSCGKPRGAAARGSAGPARRQPECRLVSIWSSSLPAFSSCSRRPPSSSP